MLVAGEERWTRYFTGRFFAGATEKKNLGSFRAWQLPSVLRLHRASADITLARVDLFSRCLFPAHEYLRIPEWIGMVAPVPATNAAFTNSSAQNDIQAIANKGLSASVTHRQADLELHLEQDYYPYTRLRHGEDAYTYPALFLRKIFRRGGLLQVLKEGKPVAGLVFEKQKDTFQMMTIACRNGDPSHMNSRALAALYLFSFEYARSAGLSFIDMRGCRPCATDGLFFVKRKWGGLVRENRDISFDCLIHWPEVNQPVLDFFSRSPLLFRDGRGLSLLASHPELHAEKARQANAVRVLSPHQKLTQ
jgi:hypothetical protein